MQLWCRQLLAGDWADAPSVHVCLLLLRLRMVMMVAVVMIVVVIIAIWSQGGGNAGLVGLGGNVMGLVWMGKRIRSGVVITTDSVLGCWCDIGGEWMLLK